MPSYAITAPDGKSYKIEAPEGTSKEDALSYFQQNWKPPEPTITPRKTPERWADVATQAVSNIPKSAANLVSGVAQTIAHPIDTATAIKDIAVGGAANVLPEAIAPSATLEQKQKATALADFYKDRYGSMEGFKRAIAEDPLGVASDVSTLATGGGALAAKVPGMAKVAQVATRAGEVANPVGMVTGAIGKGAGFAGNRAADVLGMTTGVGGEAIRQAYGAGKAGGEKAQAFARNLRGDVPATDILDTAKSALETIKGNAQSKYRSGMVDIKNDKAILDFGDIDAALQKGYERAGYQGKTVNEKATAKINEAQKAVDDWRNDDPNKFATPEGMDALKRKIGVILEDIPFEQKNARGIVGDIYTAVRNTISKQAPTYSNVMNDYHTAMDQITEIERALSLGKKPAADTAMRKLQSTMRNNVNTNYGNRLEMVKTLEKEGGQSLMPGLAGQAMSSWTPRGLQGVTGGGTALYGLASNPSALAALPLTSPRVVGEGALLGGRIAGGAGKAGSELSDIIDASKIDPKLLANYLYQAQQPKEIQ